MTNKKITDLVELTTPTTDDVFPLVDIATNSTKKAQLANLPISTATQTALDAKQATLVSGTNIKTINSTSLLGSGNISIAANPAGTAGQIQFSDGSAFAADSNLFWDNTNKRLGVGTSSPSAKIDAYVSGTGTGDFLLGKFKYQTGGASRNVFLKLGAGTSLFDINVNADNPYYEIRYGNNDATLGAGLAQRVLYNGQTAIPNSTVIGDSVIQSTARLLVKGSGSTSATTSLLVQNSSGTQLMKVTDDGVLYSQSIRSTGNLDIGTSNATRYIFTSGQIHPLGGQELGRGDTSSSFLWSNSFFSGYMHITDGTLSSGTYNSTAKLQVDSTTKGFLPPRMTTTQKNAIASPASGLMVYDTTTNKLCCYNGTSWNDLF